MVELEILEDNRHITVAKTKCGLCRDFRRPASQPPKFYFDNLSGNKLNCKIKFWLMAGGLPGFRLRQSAQCLAKALCTS